MTQLEKLIQDVKEQNLTKSQLEEYHSLLTGLYASMMLEMASLEKLEATYFATHQEKTDVSAKRKWQGTHEGLRLLELKRFAKATEKLLSSVKSRIFASMY